MNIEVAGLKLQNHVMNAAYIHSKKTEDIKQLINSAAGAIVVGSITVLARTNNQRPGYWRHEEGFYSLNSYGMPNDGLAYFKNELPKIVKLAHEKNKPVIVNVAGFSKKEFVQLIDLAQASGADMVELNLGCPNVWNNGQQKRIMSYQPSLVKELLDYIREFEPSIKIAVKISPLPPDILSEIAKIICNSKIVKVVVATNSYPNAFLSTRTKLGFAGMTGRALKPISLGVVKQLHDLLSSNVAIIGCGGISSPHDVDDYLAAGAKAVQVATVLVDEGLGIFESLIASK
jgi:dihydroorotate dehydrogenase (fumarate)